MLLERVFEVRAKKEAEFRAANLEVVGGLLTAWISGSSLYGAWWSGRGR